MELTKKLKNFMDAIFLLIRKGIFHKNTAARKVSRITKAVNTLA